MRLLKRLWTIGDGGPRRASRRRAVPGVEGLEKREVLYAASGNAWPAAQLVTISFMPDGTNVGGKTSDLQARFNAMFGSAAAWQNTILKAAQTWASYANINFEIVADSGAAQGSGSYQQGDPGFGDIRIGGNNFNSSTLATAYMPPPVNNYSVAGDIQFNTGQVYKNGNTYDLFTVAAHEIGHALGLYHTPTSAAQEYASYNATKSAFNSDDIAGVQAIYGGARKPDSYDATGANDSLASADDVSALVNNAKLQGSLTGLDITTTADVDYYKFTAPAGSSNVVNVTVSSNGISLLAPSITLYNAAGTSLASLTAAGQYGTSQTLSWSGIQPGQTYTIKVDGADGTVFGTGAYGLGVSLSGGPVPAIAGPITQKANGSPIQSGGGLALVVTSEALANTFTSGTQTASPNRDSVAVNSRGDSVIAWASNGQDGGDYGVYAQRYDAAGARVGAEFRVNTTTASDQTNPAVAIDAAGNIVIAWQSDGQDGSGYSIYAQRYNSAGIPQGGEFRVNTYTASDQTNPAVAVDALGNIVIAWQSDGQDGGGWGIYARRYTFIGVPLGGELRINTTTANDQSNPSIASDALGNVAVAWQGQDGSGKGIFARRFSVSGLPLGGEFQVNTYTTSDQSIPSVAMSSRGDWAVVWQSSGQDGGGTGTYAQRYDIVGARTGGEFRVNTTTSGNQMNPAAAMNNAGDLLVTWVNNDATKWSIYGQQYTASGAPSGGEFLVGMTKGYTVNNPSVALNETGAAIVVWTGGNTADKDGVLMQRFTLTLVEDRGFEGHRARQLEIVNLLEAHRAARKAGDLAGMKETRRAISRLRAAPRAWRSQAGH